MEWVATLLARSTINNYKRLVQQADEAAGLHERLQLEAEEKLDKAESRLFAATERGDYYRRQTLSLQEEVKAAQAQLKDAQARVQTLEETLEVSTTRQGERIDRLERLNYFLSRESQRCRLSLSRARSETETVRWAAEQLRRRTLADERRIDDLLEAQTGLQRRVDELAPFRARYERWKRTFRGRKRDESGRVLPQETAPAKEPA